MILCNTLGGWGGVSSVLAFRQKESQGHFQLYDSSPYKTWRQALQNFRITVHHLCAFKARAYCIWRASCVATKHLKKNYLGMALLELHWILQVCCVRMKMGEEGKGELGD